jgi:hypothetical protein
MGQARGRLVELLVRIDHGLRGEVRLAGSPVPQRHGGRDGLERLRVFTLSRDAVHDHRVNVSARVNATSCVVSAARISCGCSRSQCNERPCPSRARRASARCPDRPVTDGGPAFLG